MNHKQLTQRCWSSRLPEHSYFATSHVQRLPLSPECSLLVVMRQARGSNHNIKNSLLAPSPVCTRLHTHGLQPLALTSSGQARTYLIYIWHKGAVSTTLGAALYDRRLASILRYVHSRKLLRAVE